VTNISVKREITENINNARKLLPFTVGHPVQMGSA
jgi:hypothetical protein